MVFFVNSVNKSMLADNQTDQPLFNHYLVVVFFQDAI
jgi:hypothetical protein